MFGIGGFELFLILIFAFLIFGPDKLPTIAKTVGKAIAKFREAQEGMSEQLKTASFIDKDSDTPFKNPLDVVESAGAAAKSATKSAVAGGSAAVQAASDVANAAADKAASHSSGFAERKAAYDAQRAARKRAEAEAAKNNTDALAEQSENPKADVAHKSATEAIAAGVSAGDAFAAAKDKLKSGKAAATEDKPAGVSPSQTQDDSKDADNVSPSVNSESLNEGGAN